MYDLQLTANALTDALRLEDILYRTHDERERRTQLMTDVGEKAQLDIRHLLLHFHALPQTVIDGNSVYRQSDEQGYAQTVEQQSPPAEPYRPLYVNHELDGIVHIGSFAVGGPHVEDVRPVPQVTIGDATQVGRFVPVLVHAFQPVVIVNLIDAYVVECCVVDGDVASVLDGDSVAAQGLILYLDTRDAQRRYGVRAADKSRVERAVAVRISEEDGAVCGQQRFGFREVRVFFALQRIVIIEVACLEVQLGDVALRAEPDVRSVGYHREDNVVESLYVNELFGRVLRVQRQQSSAERTQP